MTKQDHASTPTVAPFVRIILDVKEWNRRWVEGEARAIDFEVEAIAGTDRQLITKGTGHVIAIRDADGDLILDLNPLVGHLCGCVNAVALLSNLTFG